MAKSIAQQVEMLRQAAAPRLITGGEAIVLLIGLAGIAVGFEIGFFFIAIFLMFALTRLEQAPYLRNALRALDAGKRVADTVRIEVSTSEDWKYYQASVTDMNGMAWTFFFKPLGWEPQEGEHAAEFFFMDPAKCPALAMTEAGIVIPGSKPKRVRTKSNRPALLILSLLCLGIASLLMVGSWRSYLANIDPPTLSMTIFMSAFGIPFLLIGCFLMIRILRHNARPCRRPRGITPPAPRLPGAGCSGTGRSRTASRSRR